MRPRGAKGELGPAGPQGPQRAQGETGPAGFPGPPSPAATQVEHGDSGPRIRQVQRDCADDQECTVQCAQGEVALSAVCPKKAPALLDSPRDISCGTGNSAAMIAFCASGLGSIAPLPTAAQDVNLALLKCAEFLKSDPEATKIIMLWLAGYYTYEGDPTVIGLGTLKRKEQQIKQYCIDNETMSLISASEIFMDKKYNP